MRKDLFQLPLIEDEPVGAARHGQAKLAAAHHRIDEHGRDGALAVRYQADALDPDLGAILQEVVDHPLIDDLPVVLLKHGVAVMTGEVAGPRQRHVDGDRRDPFAPLPRLHPVEVPGDLGPVEDQLGMIGHAAHGTFLLVRPRADG